MYKILYEIYYRMMAIIVNIEIYFNKAINYLDLYEKQIKASIILISDSDEIKILNNIDDDMNLDYDFGIVEKKINDKICHYLFDEVDTTDIPILFNDPIKNVIFSLEILYNNKNYLIDTTNINYCFDNNILFFKDHIKYIMKKNENIEIEDDYKLTMIDHDCNIIILNQNQYIHLSQHTKNYYKIITK